jgi:hypothetical protein
MTPTHKLPPHLGGWPCRTLGQRVFGIAAIDPADPGRHEITLDLVEYAVSAPDEPKLHRIYLNADQLEPVPPAQPPMPPEPPIGAMVRDDDFDLWTRTDLGWTMSPSATDGKPWEKLLKDFGPVVRVIDDPAETHWLIPKVPIEHDGWIGDYRGHDFVASMSYGIEDYLTPQQAREHAAHYLAAADECDRRRNAGQS